MKITISLELSTLDRRAIASFYGHADTLASSELCERFIREELGKAIAAIEVDHLMGLGLNEYEDDEQPEALEQEAEETLTPAEYVKKYGPPKPEDVTGPIPIDDEDALLLWGIAEAKRRAADLEAAKRGEKQFPVIQTESAQRRKQAGLSMGDAMYWVRQGQRAIAETKEVDDVEGAPV